ncbi:MAG: hypothetical protein ACK5RG_03975 [Cyclobacteriaceae bacterium]|jgi:hypothetical protein
MSYTIQQHLTYSVWAAERIKKTLEAMDWRQTAQSGQTPIN